MIKYSDCSNGYKYGTDGKQLANWNPDKDYGEVYAKVYFRIDTPIYQYPFNNYSKEDMEAFYQEVNGILDTFGFHKPEEKYVVGLVCGKERLHVHPQEVSGEVKKNRIKQIVEALDEKGTLFSIRWVDVYATYYDMTDAEYRNKLDEKRPEMEEKIKELAMTKRRDYFKSAESIASLLGKEFFVHRVGERNNDTQKDKQAAEQYVLGVIQRMIQDEVLDSSTAKDGTFVIRTIKEKERKKRTAAKANSLAMQA